MFETLTDALAEAALATSATNDARREVTRRLGDGGREGGGLVVVRETNGSGPRRTAIMATAPNARRMPVLRNEERNAREPTGIS
jgi:hypothetical protein